MYECTQQLLKGSFTYRNCCFSSFKGGGCSLKYAFFLGFFFSLLHTLVVSSLWARPLHKSWIIPGLSQHDRVILLLARPFWFLSTLLSVAGLKTSLPISSAWIPPPPPPRHWNVFWPRRSHFAAVTSLICHRQDRKQAGVRGLKCILHFNFRISHIHCVTAGAVLCFTKPGFTAAVSRLVILAPPKI